MKQQKFVIAFVAGLMATLTFTPTASAQSTGAVRGTVTDSASNRPIEGVQVTLSATNVGAVSNENGQYVSRNVPPGTYTARALRLGFAAVQRQITVAANDTVSADFTMRAAAVNLSQVVVVGYGTANRREVSSAVATVTPEAIVNAPLASIDGALQGKAAGLQVIPSREVQTARSGRPAWAESSTANSRSESLFTSSDKARTNRLCSSQRPCCPSRRSAWTRRFW